MPAQIGSGDEIRQPATIPTYFNSARLCAKQKSKSRNFVRINETMLRYTNVAVVIIDRRTASYY